MVRHPSGMFADTSRGRQSSRKAFSLSLNYCFPASAINASLSGCWWSWRQIRGSQAVEGPVKRPNAPAPEACKPKEMGEKIQWPEMCFGDASGDEVRLMIQICDQINSQFRSKC